jgi:hypothetical protein
MAELETGAASQPAETPADDLRAALAESLIEHDAEIPEVETGEAKPERARGADGKFLPKDASTDGEEPAAKPASEAKPEKAPEDGKTGTGEQAATAAAPTTVEAPVHWSQSDKEKFGSLPAEAQAPFLEMYNRMWAGLTPKLQRGAQLERDYGPIEQMFAPHAEALRARGQVPANIIAIWGQVEQTLTNHQRAVDSGQAPGDTGAQAIARMIAGYKINPAEVAKWLTSDIPQQAAPQPQRTELPPEVAARIAALEQEATQRKTADGEQRLATAKRQIDAFANEKDAEGNLKHPFFADIENDMMVQARLDMAAGKTPELSDLYDRAVYANRETRAKLLALDKENEQKRAAVERKAKAEAAKRTAVSVTGSPGANQTPTPSRNSGASVSDDLRASLEEMRG